MGKLVSSLIAAGALLLAFAAPVKAEESNRGFYEGSLPGGGKVVFFASGNHVISVYALDTANHKAYFGSATLNDDGTFSVTVNGGIVVSGSISNGTITATTGSINITATLINSFGNFASIAGRFNGLAHSASRDLTDVRFMIDSDGRIFFVGLDGDQPVGGSGNVDVHQRNRQHDGENSDDDEAGDGDNGGDNNRDRGDDDSDRDEHEDQNNTQFFSGTFTITLTNGQVITGTIDFSRGHLTATFTLNGVEFTFNGDREATFNRLANISTRGLVGTGQAQLIGGFIITGGPKMVLIRGIGPSLASQGINPVLANPKLQLFQNNRLLKENDDWGTNSNADDLRKTTIAPSDAKEAALLVRLEPGSYTTVLSGSDNGTGIGLVEVYEIDRD